MIVCPACRNANDEDRETCATCGGSLAPGPAALIARRAPSERPPIEVATRKPPSRWRPYIVVGLFVATVAAGISYATLRPNPCEGRSFESGAFGYCLSVPAGWTSAPARFGDGATLDGFSAEGGTASVMVEAVDLPDATDLDGWAAIVRARDTEAGLRPRDEVRITVAGIPARRWDLVSTSEDGTEYRTREIVLVRGAIGWRVTLNETEAGFPEALDALEAMLGTWAFR